MTLRLVAQHAQMWNCFGPAKAFAAKNKALDDWCERVGRDPAEIERTVMLTDPRDVHRVEPYLEAGAQHIILGAGPPFDLEPLQVLVDEANR